jgi:hypothetical protein
MWHILATKEIPTSTAWYKIGSDGEKLPNQDSILPSVYHIFVIFKVRCRLGSVSAASVSPNPSEHLGDSILSYCPTKTPTKAHSDSSKGSREIPGAANC